MCAVIALKLNYFCDGLVFFHKSKRVYKNNKCIEGLQAQVLSALCKQLLTYFY